MEVEARCALRVAAVEWQPAPVRFALTAVAKATFTLAPGESPLAAVQDEVFDGDSHWDDDEERSLARASDLVPFKARPEVILVGQAYAPGDRATSSLVARLAVGSVDKSIRVVGDRLSLAGAPAEPFPFTKMPLRWERAAAGPGGMNPVGVRWSDADAPGRAHAPNLLPAAGARAVDGSPMPICFAPIAARWPGRAARMAAVGAWRPSAWAAAPLPTGLDPAFFNAAPDDQILAGLTGDETIELENLHPEHPVLVTRLSRVRPIAHAHTSDGRSRPIVLSPDTLLIDTVRGVASLVFRGQLLLDRPRAVERVVVTVADDGGAAAGGGWAIEDEETQVPTARGAGDDVHGGAGGASPDVTLAARFASPDVALPPRFASPDVTLPPRFASPDVTLPPRIASPDVTLPPRIASPDVTLHHRVGDPEVTALHRVASSGPPHPILSKSLEGAGAPSAGDAALPAWVSAPAGGPAQAPADGALPFRRTEGAQVGGGALGRSMRLGGPRPSEPPPPPAPGLPAEALAPPPPARVPFAAAIDPSPRPLVPPPIAQDSATPPFAHDPAAPPFAHDPAALPLPPTPLAPLLLAPNPATPLLAHDLAPPPLAQDLAPPPTAPVPLAPLPIAPPPLAHHPAPTIGQDLAPAPFAPAPLATPIAHDLATPPVAHDLAISPTAHDVATPPFATPPLAPPPLATPPFATPRFAPLPIAPPPIAHDLAPPPTAHALAPAPLAPPPGTNDPAPPPMLGPLATPEMVAADTPAAPPATAAGSPAPAMAAGAGPEGTAPPDAAPEEPAPLPLATMTLERCAALRASIDRSPDATAKLLERHELEAGTWKRLEAHWAEIVQASSKRGKSGPLRDYDAAYLAQVERERGAITPDEYARITVAVEQGVAAATLADLGIPAAALGRIQRAWIVKTARDAALGAKVRAAIERARQA